MRNLLLSFTLDNISNAFSVLKCYFWGYRYRTALALFLIFSYESHITTIIIKKQIVPFKISIFFSITAIINYFFFHIFEHIPQNVLMQNFIQFLWMIVKGSYVGTVCLIIERYKISRKKDVAILLKGHKSEDVSCVFRKWRLL